MDVSDEDIVAEIKQGNQEVFGELVERYEQKLTRYGARFLGRPESVTDMVQDVFIKAYINIQSFKSSERFSPWIYRIAHNTFVNELRRQKRQGFGFFALDTDTIFPTLAAKERADTDTLKKEDVLLMEDAIKELPPKYREVIVLYYFDEQSYESISGILRIPTATVGVRLARARNRLKEIYVRNNPIV